MLRKSGSCGSTSNRAPTDWCCWCCCRLKPRKVRCTVHRVGKSRFCRTRFYFQILRQICPVYRQIVTKSTKFYLIFPKFIKFTKLKKYTKFSKKNTKRYQIFTQFVIHAVLLQFQFLVIYALVSTPKSQGLQKNYFF